MSNFPKSEAASQILDNLSDKRNLAFEIQRDSDFWRNPETGFPEHVEPAWLSSIVRSSIVVNVQDIVMEQHKTNTINELDVVALLSDIPAENLLRGQVGTIVALAGNGLALLEFSTDDGAATAIVAISDELLLPLVYESRAA